MEPKTKITVLVEARLLTEAKRLGDKGGYRTVNDCLNEALRLLLARDRRARLETAMEEASRDEIFLADIQRTMEDFKYVDAETAKRIERR